ncbi:MAG TPA: phosphopentomutase [Bryobacteraceae bacterium]|nr:phosphopentomutase [Bryobacteraceae bacterium]
MSRFRRVVLIVLDSVGVGEMPDAAEYGDAGSNTLGNLAKARPLHLPNLGRLGLGNIAPITGVPPAEAPQACFGKCTLASPGKDTTTGHWEMAGIHLPKPFPTYPSGFPRDLIEAFEERIGRSTLGNYPASGTDIIRELGEEHVKTGSPIVYTSADSVFQIAAHESVIPIDEQYRICEIARGLLTGQNEVGRVIARPFTGEPGAFRRTANRHDYAVPPPEGMLLDRIAAAAIPVHSVGKISDVFLGRGITSSLKTKSNADGMHQTLAALEDHRSGLIWVNLVDFDSLYGHRNDVDGYGRALEEVDGWVPRLRASLQPGDLAVFCADHGCDPTTSSTDHSREYTPLLAFGPGMTGGADLGTRASLADIGATVAEVFGQTLSHGQSFLSELR